MSEERKQTPKGAKQVLQIESKSEVLKLESDKKHKKSVFASYIKSYGA